MVNGLREMSLDGAADAANAGAFLARVTRLDAGALVRIRAAEPLSLTLWAWSPLDVLVARSVAGSGPDDVTVGAAELLARLAGITAGTVGSAELPELTLPRRRDAEWRGSLPPAGPWRLLDAIPAAVVGDLVTAGEQAFDQVTAPGSGQSIAGMRAAGESLLDHETVRVSADEGGPTEVTVPFRVLIALSRMGFLGADPVGVAVLGPWLRVTAAFGVVYRRRDSVTLAL